MTTLELTLLALLGFAFLALLWLLRERYSILAERDLAQARLQDAEAAKAGFESVAGEVLRNSNAEFLKLAEQSLAAKEGHAVAEMEKRREALDRLIAPIQKAVEKTHAELRRVEKDNAGLREHVVSVAKSNRDLRAETGRLVQALGKPNVRGRYGEIQLQRVVELAGMRNYCDFTTQENLFDREGRLQKPDLVVRLPNERVVAIDAKVSFDAYMEAVASADEEQRALLLTRYAQNVYEQVVKLAKKQYWANFEESPELVVMFIPGDQLVDAALEYRPDLIEYAAQENIVIASPSTLIGLLRAIHVGWREKSLSDNAEELFRLGGELHQRAAAVLERVQRVGQSLDGATRSFNELVGSVQGRLLPTLRKFEKRGARSSKEVIEPQRLERETRELDTRQVTPDPLLPLTDPEPSEAPGL